MSIIGEVAAVVGLAGQAVNTASFTYKLILAYKRFHPEVTGLLDEILRLQDALQSVTERDYEIPNLPIRYLKELHDSVSHCQVVLNRLGAQLHHAEVASNGFFKGLRKKAKIIADADYFNDISRQIQLCRSEITLRLEILQSNTCLEICEKMDTVKIGVENIEVCQKTAIDMLQIGCCSIKTDVLDTRNEQRQGFSFLFSELDRLMSIRTSSTSKLSDEFALIDSRLKKLENQLSESTVPENPKHQPGVKLLPSGKPENELMLMRLIKPGILRYEEGGNIITQLLALDDRKAMGMSTEARLSLIRRVQSLRLLFWLLQSENYRSSIQIPFGRIWQSHLARQAKLTSLWEFCYAYTELDCVLRNRLLNMSLTIPWTACRRWLQYLFDRVEDRQEDGEYIMELTLQQWVRFPVPDTNEPATYFLPIPQRLLEYKRTPDCSLPQCEWPDATLEGKLTTGFKNYSFNPDPGSCEKSNHRLDEIENVLLDTNFPLDEQKLRDGEKFCASVTIPRRARKGLRSSFPCYDGYSAANEAQERHISNTYLYMSTPCQSFSTAIVRFNHQTTCVKCFNSFSALASEDQLLGVCKACSQVSHRKFSRGGSKTQ